MTEIMVSSTSKFFSIGHSLISSRATGGKLPDNSVHANRMNQLSAQESDKFRAPSKPPENLLIRWDTFSVITTLSHEYPIVEVFRVALL